MNHGSRFALRNVADKHPEEVEELRALYLPWGKSILPRLKPEGMEWRIFLPQFTFETDMSGKAGGAYFTVVEAL